MLEKRINEQDTTLHKNTIMPRLCYALDLLDVILSQLEKKRIETRDENLRRFGKSDNYLEPDFIRLVRLETEFCLAFECLRQIRKRMHAISDINSITTHLPSTISVIRAVNSKIHTIFPSFCQNLGELATILGSVVVDSATITEARFDFGQENVESNAILDEAKLIVGSKISKQYPNLDLAKSQLA